MNKKKRIRFLVEELNKASDAYYGGQNEVISNFEWDKMFDELSVLEQETGYILQNSPTHYISRSKSDDENNVHSVKEPHEYPALSLAKTKDVKELQKWAGDYDIWVSWKLDGLTLVLTYDNGEITKILTRGNGVTGTNISYFRDVIRGVPEKINYQGHLVVRGEATISYNDFEIINELNETGEKYANPRNLASGTLALDPTKKSVVKSRNLTFIAFSLVHVENNMVSWGKRMDFLDYLGFITVERERTNSLGIPSVVNKWSKNVTDGHIDTPVDGLVICYDDTDYASTGSITGHHATRAGLAFKWQDESAISMLKYIEWSCATSVITPIAVFEPVQLEGTMVSRASLCNISELDRLRIGGNGQTRLQIIKANKIIPKCVGVVEATGHYEIPHKCPVCKANTTVSISNKSNIKVLQCTNTNCPAKKTSRFVRFVSKNGINIEGFSIKTIIAFINKGLISQFQDIFSLSNYKEIICNMEGFAERSCTKLFEAIERSKVVNPINFIYSLSIPLIGVDAAKKIINKIGYNEFVIRVSHNKDFYDIPGIGMEKSKAILNWFNDENNKKTFNDLNSIIQIKEKSETNSVQKKCEGITFAITGSLNTFKNRREFIEYIEFQCGKVVDSVSSKINYLINNDTSSESSKNIRAKELGIPIISEKEFLALFG